MGDLETAIIQSQKAHEVFLAVHHGQEDVADSYGQLGLVYKKKGDLDNALLQFLKELEVRVAVFCGYEHSDIGFTCKEIGDVYDLQGNKAAAIEMYAQAYTICVKLKGPDDNLTMVVVGKLHRRGVPTYWVWLRRRLAMRGASKLPSEVT